MDYEKNINQLISLAKAALLMCIVIAILTTYMGFRLVREQDCPTGIANEPINESRAEYGQSVYQGTLSTGEAVYEIK